VLLLLEPWRDPHPGFQSGHEARGFWRRPVSPALHGTAPRSRDTSAASCRRERWTIASEEWKVSRGAHPGWNHSHAAGRRETRLQGGQWRPECEEAMRNARRASGRYASLTGEAWKQEPANAQLMRARLTTGARWAVALTVGGDRVWARAWRFWWGPLRCEGESPTRRRPESWRSGSCDGIAEAGWTALHAERCAVRAAAGQPDGRVAVEGESRDSAHLALYSRG